MGFETASTGTPAQAQILNARAHFTFMRHIFDQYQQSENRLTHALAVCLNEDRALLREFIAWIGVAASAPATKLFIVEQGLPGDPPESEEDAEQRGLPDVVVHDGAEWCLLIESKVQAMLTEDQLARHEKTLRRRGFAKVIRLVLTKKNVRSRRTISLSWSDLYEWLGRLKRKSE
jgi:hypothetical protein